MIYELRLYETVPGRLPALNDRFAKHTVGFFKKYGVRMLGFWTDDIGSTNLLSYIVSFESSSERESTWKAFRADPDWLEVRAETEKDGPLLARVRNTIMRLTSYSPEPVINSNVQELRDYQSMPGKLDALNARFANHTIPLFEKHGIENIGYWTDDVGTSEQLIYMLGYPSLGDREKSWASFQADPEWQRVRAETEKDGVLTAKAVNTIIRLTPYSPR
ncbi:MAG: NIPSNAP family protein [Dehalococcoidia bacterium]|nr:NIPSNAP family protein [Dehalococcoidia bacterium]